jgi:hypothetical protein
MVKDVCETQDDRIKKILRNIGEVIENSDLQEKRIDEIVQGIEVCMRTLQYVIIQIMQSYLTRLICAHKQFVH